MRSAPSLMARAVAHLARRDFSRAELARKLAPHANDPEQLAEVLDRLEAQRLLSDERFAAGWARRRANAGQGSAKVLHELRQRGVDGETLQSTRSELEANELVTAQAAWQKRFGSSPQTQQDRLRQMRFLAGRGFPLDVINQVVPKVSREP